MTLLKNTLTNPHDERKSDMLTKSVKHMAHFAGTGPEGATCGQCEEYKTISKSGKALRDKKRPCQKFRRMMHVKSSDAIPRDTPSCMFFTPIDAA